MEKISVRLTVGEKVYALDNLSEVLVLSVEEDAHVRELGQASLMGKGSMISASLITMPEELYMMVMEFVKEKREERSKEQTGLHRVK